MNTVELLVEGMRCRHCVRQATALLRDVPGVTMVTADATSGFISVTGAVTTAAILAAFQETSFTVRLSVRDQMPGPGGRRRQRSTTRGEDSDPVTKSTVRP